MKIKDFIKLVGIPEKGKDYDGWKAMQVVLQFYGLSPDKARALCREYIWWANNLAQHNGGRYAVKVLKDLNTQANRCTLGCTHQGSTIVLNGTRFLCYAETGIPKMLPALNSVILEFPRAANSMTALVRLFISDVDTNVASIECESAENAEHTQLVKGVLHQYLTNNALPVAQPLAVHELNTGHITMSSGPHGAPAVLHCASDVKTLRHYEPLFSTIIARLWVTGQTHLCRTLLLFCKGGEDCDYGSRNRWVLARLAFLQDKAGKTRIVYILNYLLQEALFPLHSYVMEWLRGQTQDGTYDQGRAASKVQEATRKGEPTWSFDLTAATDRFPIWYQLMILPYLVGQDWTDLWKEIMIIQPYSYDLGRFVEYAVGQPMGALSSWAVFTLSHHILVRSICFQLGVPAQGAYVILGDDIVIFHSKVADMYSQALTAMGVTISQGKSVVPSMLKAGYHSAEFAKKLFANGRNLSPISSLLLYEVFELHQYWKIIDLFREAEGYGAVGLILLEGSFLLHPLLVALVNHLNFSERRKVLTLLSAPCAILTHQRFDGNEAYDTWKEYHNPWTVNRYNEKVDPDVIQISMCTIAFNKLQIQMEKLISLTRNVRARQEGELTDGISNRDNLVDPNHPIWNAIERLEDLFPLIEYELMRMDPADKRIDKLPRIADFMVEVDFMLEVVLGDVSYHSFLSKKERRNKHLTKLLLSVHKEVTSSAEFLNSVTNF